MKKRWLAVATLALVSSLCFANVSADEHQQGGTPEVNPTVAHDEAECMTGDPEVKVEATCTTQGILRYECKVNEGFFHETYYGPLGHDYDEGKVTTTATCTQGQVKVYTCKRCGDTYEEVGEPLNHVYEEVVYVEPTCKTKGKSHEVCKYCGAIKANSDKEIAIDPDAHQFDGWIVDKAPTCEEDGVAIRWCKLCGQKQFTSDYETYPELESKIAAIGHDWVKTMEQKDCYTAIQHYVCQNDKTHVHEDEGKEVEIDPPVHKYIISDEYIVDDEEYTFPATCEEKGQIAYKCVYHDDNEKHTEDDYKLVELAALGHKWKDWTLRYNVKDGDNEYGYWMRECSVCGKIEERVSEDEPGNDNGLIQDVDGVWRLYDNGELQDSYTGLYTYDGAQFYLENGVMTERNGLTLIDEVWYFLAAGKVTAPESGFAEYRDNWFLIKDDGILNYDGNGLYDYDGGTFAFSTGKLRRDIEGLWQNPLDNEWYYLSAGQVHTEYSGVVGYNGAFFVVADGMLDKTYNGTIEYDGATFKVVAGQLYEQVETAA